MLLRSRLMNSSKVCISNFFLLFLIMFALRSLAIPYLNPRESSPPFRHESHLRNWKTHLFYKLDLTRSTIFSAVPHLAHPTISPSNAISPMTIKHLSVISAINQRILITTSICLPSPVSFRTRLSSRLPLTVPQPPCLNTLPSLRNAIAVVQLYHRAAELLWSLISYNIFFTPVLCPTVSYIMVACHLPHQNRWRTRSSPPLPI